MHSGMLGKSSDECFTLGEVSSNRYKKKYTLNQIYVNNLYITWVSASIVTRYTKARPNECGYF